MIKTTGARPRVRRERNVVRRQSSDLSQERVCTQPRMRLELAAHGAENRSIALLPRVLLGELGAYPRQLPEDLSMTAGPRELVTPLLLSV